MDNDHLNINDNFSRNISNDHTIQKIEEDYKNLDYHNLNENEVPEESSFKKSKKSIETLKVKSKFAIYLRNNQINSNNSYFTLKTNLFRTTFVDLNFTTNCYFKNSTYFQNNLIITMKNLIYPYRYNISISRNSFEINKSFNKGNISFSNTTYNPYFRKSIDLSNSFNCDLYNNYFSNYTFKYKSDIDSEKYLKKEYNSGIYNNDELGFNLNVKNKFYFINGKISFIKIINDESNNNLNRKFNQVDVFKKQDNHSIENSNFSFKFTNNLKEVKIENGCIYNNLYFSTFIKPLTMQRYNTINNRTNFNDEFSLSNTLGFKIGIRIHDLFVYLKISKSFFLFNSCIKLDNNLSNSFDNRFLEKTIITVGIKNRYMDFKLPISNVNGSIKDLLVFKLKQESESEIKYKITNPGNTLSEEDISNKSNIFNVCLSLGRVIVKFIGMSLFKYFTFKLFLFIGNYIACKKLIKKKEERLENLKYLNSLYIQFNQKLLGNALKVYEKELKDKDNGLVILFGLIGSYEKLVTIYNDSFYVDYNENEIIYIRKKPEKENFINLLEITIFLLNNIITIKKDNLNSNELSYKKDNYRYCFSKREHFDKFIEIDFSLINNNEKNKGCNNNMLGIYNPLLDINETLWILVVFTYKQTRYVKFCKADKKVSIP